MGLHHILRICVRENKVYDILHSCHNEPSQGNYAPKRKTYKVLQMIYHWTTMFKDANQYVSRCDYCQRMGNPNKRDEITLNHQVTWETFEK